MTPLQATYESLDRIIDTWVEQYEFDAAEDGYHCPSNDERVLIDDAIQGLLAQDDFVAAFNAWQDIVRVTKL